MVAVGKEIVKKGQIVYQLYRGINIQYNVHIIKFNEY